jgi:fibronectin-binding autotransporter adhesin
MSMTSISVFNNNSLSKKSIPQPPPTPTGLSYTSSTTTSITVSWNAVPSATSYILNVTNVTASNSGSISGITGTSGTITTYGSYSISQNNQYTITIQSVNSAGTSNNSAEISVTTPSPFSVSGISGTLNGSYYYYTITTAGNTTVTFNSVTKSTIVQFLLIGGGGGGSNGGTGNGGGGGAGGYSQGSFDLYSYGTGTFSLIFSVGAGGVQRWSPAGGANSKGNSGNPTYIYKSSSNTIITAAGGGGAGGSGSSGVNGSTSMSSPASYTFTGTQISSGGGTTNTFGAATGSNPGGIGFSGKGGGGGGKGSAGGNAGANAGAGGNGVVISMAAYGFPDSAAPGYTTAGSALYCAGASGAGGFVSPSGSWIIGGGTSGPTQNTGSGGIVNDGANGFIVICILASAYA